MRIKTNGYIFFTDKRPEKLICYVRSQELPKHINGCGLELVDRYYFYTENGDIYKQSVFANKILPTNEIRSSYPKQVLWYRNDVPIDDVECVQLCCDDPKPTQDRIDYEKMSWVKPKEQ